jgi:hypothetical protein
MRSVLLLATLCLAGCVQTRHFDNAQECPVYDVVDKPTRGLVNLAPELEHDLRALTPKRPWPEKVCWYQEPTGNLLAMFRRHPDGPLDMGFEYQLQGTKWIFLKENEYVVLTHERRK